MRLILMIALSWWFLLFQIPETVLASPSIDFANTSIHSHLMITFNQSETEEKIGEDCSYCRGCDECSGTDCQECSDCEESSQGYIDCTDCIDCYGCYEDGCDECSSCEVCYQSSS
jgi:hypothetical protein